MNVSCSYLTLVTICVCLKISRLIQQTQIVTSVKYEQETFMGINHFGFFYWINDLVVKAILLYNNQIRVH